MEWPNKSLEDLVKEFVKKYLNKNNRISAEICESITGSIFQRISYVFKKKNLQKKTFMVKFWKGSIKKSRSSGLKLWKNSWRTFWGDRFSKGLMPEWTTRVIFEVICGRFSGAIFHFLTLSLEEFLKKKNRCWFSDRALAEISDVEGFL